MRLQADGRGLQDVSINERHASLADSLYMAEKQARIETEQRSLIQNQIKLAQAQQREAEIRKAATMAKEEKESLLASSFSDFHNESSASRPMSRQEQNEIEAAKRERDEIRRMLRKENERNRRMAVAGKNRTKEERDNERDISEKIALGQA